MSELHDDTVDLAQGIRLGRREVLTAALLGAGAVVIGPPGAALAAQDDKRHDFEVAQPGFDDKREWVHLRLDPASKARAVPLTITGRGRTEGTIKVSNSTGFVAVAAAADSRAGNHPAAHRRGPASQRLNLRPHGAAADLPHSHMHVEIPKTPLCNPGLAAFVTVS